MTSDNDDENGQKDRDEKGRWLPGHCPNPKGRPRKPLLPEVDESDIRVFRNSVVEFNIAGEKQYMTRENALLHKIFEGAMRGKVTSQRFLYKIFEENSQMMAEARLRYDQLIIDWQINSDRHDRDIPFEVELEILSLQAVLHHYFPSQYPCPRAPDDHCPDCSMLNAGRYEDRAGFADDESDYDED